MKNVILIVCALAFFYSCKKDNSSENTNSDKSAYLPLAVGNYWVYQTFNIDSAGNETQSAKIDSTLITKDTLIGGEKYYKLENYAFTFGTGEVSKDSFSYFYRDSAKNLVSLNGQISFSEENVTDILLQKTFVTDDGDTIYVMTCKMVPMNVEYTVPAGSFSNVLNFQGTVTCSPEYAGIENPRYVNNLYAKGVGKILSSNFYVFSRGSMETRLLRYKIN
jgi:hypothetical protein